MRWMLSKQIQLQSGLSSWRLTRHRKKLMLRPCSHRKSRQQQPQAQREERGGEHRYQRQRGETAPSQALAGSRQGQVRRMQALREQLLETRVMIDRMRVMIDPMLAELTALAMLAELIALEQEVRARRSLGS